MNYCEMERALARHIHLEQQSAVRSARLRGELRLSMTATPAYRLSSDGLTGDVSCDAFTCHIFRREGKALCQLEMWRAEGRCAAAPGGAALTGLRWFPIQVMKPWEYPEGTDPLAGLGDYPELPAPAGGDSADLLEMRNVQNLFFEHRLHDLAGLFSRRPDASLSIEYLGIDGTGGLVRSLDQCAQWLARETENAHCYLFLGTAGMPVIEVSPDGERAQGLFMTQLYQCRAAAYSNDPSGWTLGRMLSVTRSEFVKEDGGWKLLHMDIRNLAALPGVPYGTTGRYDRSGKSVDPWPVEQTLGPAPAPEDAMKIENLINGWAYGCRRGELPAYIEAHMKNSLGRNRMHIRSFGRETPVLDSFEKITEKIMDMTAQYREEYYTFHAPTTPVLRQIGEDCVLGTWFDCAATNLRGMAKSRESVPYMAFVNKYTHRFERIDSKWYLTDFQNEPAISLPDWELDMKHNTGWLIRGTTRKFPAVFQEDDPS